MQKCYRDVRWYSYLLLCVDCTWQHNCLDWHRERACFIFCQIYSLWYAISTHLCLNCAVTVLFQKYWISEFSFCSFCDIFSLWRAVVPHVDVLVQIIMWNFLSFSLCLMIICVRITCMWTLRWIVVCLCTPLVSCLCHWYLHFLIGRVFS